MVKLCYCLNSIAKVAIIFLICKTFLENFQKNNRAALTGGPTNRDMKWGESPISSLTTVQI